MNIYIAIYIFSVLISSVAQILLKLSAGEKHENLLKEYMNWKVIVAYGILFCASLITIYAYKGLPLSYGIVLESCGYVFVTILSYIILKEKIGKKKALGMICILIGIFISHV